jgi:hypothetical protein
VWATHGSAHILGCRQNLPCTTPNACTQPGWPRRRECMQVLSACTACFRVCYRSLARVLPRLWLGPTRCLVGGSNAAATHGMGRLTVAVQEQCERSPGQTSLAPWQQLLGCYGMPPGGVPPVPWLSGVCAMYPLGCGAQSCICGCVGLDFFSTWQPSDGSCKCCRPYCGACPHAAESAT